VAAVRVTEPFDAPRTPATEPFDAPPPNATESFDVPQTKVTESFDAPPPNTVRLARSISILTVGQIVTWIATLTWTVIVPRRLGSAQVGIYTLGLAASGVLLVLVGLGLRPLLVREIASNPERAPQLIGTGIVLRAIFCLPALAVTLVITLVGPFRGVEGTAVFLGWCMTVFAVVSEPIAAGFQAMEKMRYLTYSTIFSRIVSTVSAIALVLFGVRAIGLLLAAVVIGAVLTVLMLIWSRPHFHIDWRVKRHELRRLFIASLPYWSFVAFFTIYLWIDSLMLGAMTSTTVLGWYGLPTQLFGTLMFIPTVLSTAWLSQLVRAHKGGPQSLVKAARPAIEFVLVLSLPVCVGAVLVAAPLVRVLYGPEFTESIPVFALLSLCVPPMYLNIMANQLMIARNQQMVWTKMMALASLINPALNLVLIPYFQHTQGNGAIGASIAMVITEVVLAVIGYVLVRDTFTRNSVVRVLRAALATALMAGVVTFALRAGLVAGIVSGMISFPLFAGLLGVLSAAERHQLWDLLGAIAPRRRPRPSGSAS
jgi:O-antigen/teichoic acid export membrane protein